MFRAVGVMFGFAPRRPSAVASRSASRPRTLRPAAPVTDSFVENTPWRNTPQGRAIPWMEIREVLALNLRKLRQAKRLSQEELAYRAEIDRTYISALERSVYSASIDVVDRLARVLGVE